MKLLNKVTSYIASVLMLGLAYVAAYTQRYQTCGLMAQTFPTLAQFAANLAVSTDAIDIIYQPQYDYNVYPTAGLLQMQFFQTPQGQGNSASPGNAGNTKALSDTNMTSQGTFPAPQAFWVNGIEVSVDPGASAANATTYTSQIPTGFATASAAAVQAGEYDVNAIYKSGVLVFSIGTKTYYQEAPLVRFPTKNYLHMDTAVASTSGTAGEIVKCKYNVEGAPVRLSPGVGIMTSQNFLVSLQWPVLVATPSTNNARIGVILDGYLFRGVQ